MEPIELVRRGAPYGEEAELFACGACGHVYSPTIYACGIDEGRRHARAAAASCVLCRRAAETPGQSVERESDARQRRIAAAKQVSDMGECFSDSSDAFYQDVTEAADAGETGVFRAVFERYSLDAGAILSAMIENHHEDASIDDLEGVGEFVRAVDAFNALQTRGSYTMDTKEWQPVKQDRTFAMIKPDATARGVEEDMIADIEAAGFRVVGRERRRLQVEEAEWLYREHASRDHFRDLVDYTVSGDVVLLVLEADEDDAATAFRRLMGPTDRTKAEPHTLRAKYAIGLRENSIHGSDSPAAAIDEIARLG